MFPVQPSILPFSTEVKHSQPLPAPFPFSLFSPINLLSISSCLGISFLAHHEFRKVLQPHSTFQGACSSLPFLICTSLLTVRSLRFTILNTFTYVDNLLCIHIQHLTYTFFDFHNLVLTAMDRRRRQWHPTPVLLPGKSHGQRSLVSCSPWGR